MAASTTPAINFGPWATIEMKEGIHPDYNFMSVKLADGTIFTTRSTMGVEQYSSEVDSSNHPFYTGKRTMVDTAGRVEKFRRRYGGEEEQADSDE